MIGDNNAVHTYVYCFPSIFWRQYTLHPAAHCQLPLYTSVQMYAACCGAINMHIGYCVNKKPAEV